jgi:hypothetical protein
MPGMEGTIGTCRTPSYYRQEGDPWGRGRGSGSVVLRSHSEAVTQAEPTLMFLPCFS